MLTHTQIRSCIPHEGAMCLLDTVESWDVNRIVCQAAPPTADHPLARGPSVPAIVAVEYAAQAAAVHGALLDKSDQPRRGVLAKLADVELADVVLGASGGRLVVHAELMSRADSGCMYRFEVTEQHVCIARGRLTVAFPP